MAKKDNLPSPGDFLKAVERRPHAGGQKCGTCNHEHADAINEWLVETYKGAKRKRLAIAPSRVIKEVLGPHFGYTLQPASLRRHMEKCLGLEVE